MSKRKASYARYIASVVAASMALPPIMPPMATYAQTRMDEAGTDSPTPSTPLPVSDGMGRDAIMKAQYQLGLSVTNIKSKEWDGTDAVTGNYSRQLSGIIAGHEKVAIESMDIYFEDSGLGAGKTVVVDHITLAGEDADLYKMAKDQFVFQTDAAITKRVLNITGGAADRYYVEGDVSTPFRLSLSNVAPCDAQNGNLIEENLSVTVTGRYPDDNAGTGKTVTVDNIEVSGSHAAYYTVNSQLDGLSGTILKARRNAPDLAYNNKEITGTNPAMEYRISGGDWLTCSGSILLTDTGIYEVRYKETDNYEASGIFKLTYGSAVTDPSGFYFDFQDGFVPTKEYDGTTKAAAKLKVGGIVDGDEVKIESYSIAYESPAVNDSVNVTLSNIKLGGKDAEKYQPYADQIAHTVKGIIKPRTIDVHIAANDKDYDGTAAANLYVCGHTGYVGNEEVDIAVSGTFQDAAAGDGKEISVTEVALTGTDRGNYAIGTVKPAKIQDGNLVELEKLTASIRKAPQDAPDKKLFSISDGKITGYTADMEVLLPGESTYRDCAGLSGIPVTEGSTYVFRYKGKENYKAGATTTINIGIVKTVTITFDLNGEKVTGTYPATATKATGQKYGDILLDVIPENPDREFIGWFTQANGGDQVNPDDICDRAADFTLYAHFTDKKSDRKDGKITVHMDSSTYGDAQNPPSAENITGDYTDYVYYYKKAGEPDEAYSVENPKLPGEYTVKAVAQKTSQYNEAEATATYTIRKRLLTASFAAADRIYNGTAKCGGTLSVDGSKISGDNMEIDSTGLTAVFADKNVGVGKKVTVTGIVLTGSDADRYELEIKNASADITPYPLNYKATPVQESDGNAFSISADEKVYDGFSAAALHVQFTKIAGDDVEIKAAGAFGNPNAGSDKDIVISSVSVTGADAGNYILSSQSGMVIKGTIKKAANGRYPDISGTNPTLGKNNGSITGLTTDMEYSLDGGTTWQPCVTSSLKNLAPGEYKVRYKETENYRASGISSITLKDSSSQAITITFDLCGEAVTGEYPTTASAVKGAVLGDVIRAVTPADPSREFLGWFTEPSGGKEITAAMVCEFDGPVTLYAHFKMKEEKQEGKISVSMEDFTYGDIEAPVVSNELGNYSNYTFLYKKTEAADGEYTTAIPSIPGNYTVKAVAAATESYSQAEAVALFTIQPRVLDMVFTADEKVYDGSTSVYGYQYRYENLLEEDEGKVAFDLSGVEVHYQDKHAGENKPLVIGGIKLAGKKAACYALPQTITGTGKISKKTLSADITGLSKMYDGTDKASVDIKLKGTVESDTVTAQYQARFENAEEGIGKKVYVTEIALAGKDAANYGLDMVQAETMADITAGIQKPEEQSYTVRYETSSGRVLKEVSGKGEIGAEVSMQPFELSGYQAAAQTFTLFSGDNRFTVICTPITYTVAVQKELDGRITETISGSYTVEEPYLETTGMNNRHTMYQGYTGSWFEGMKGESSGTGWSFALPAGITGNIAITLHFVTEQPDIRFDGAGGTGNMPGVYLEDGGKRLNPCTYQKAGYAFVGWALSKDGAVAYPNQAEIAGIDISGGITLYAVWEAVANTVHFDLNGGSSLTEIVDSIQMKMGDAYPALPHVVPADGSQPFIGWFTEDGRQIREGDSYGGELILYAHFGARSEGKIEVSAKGYSYGDEPDIDVRVLLGDYGADSFSYQYRLQSESIWNSGLPAVPGEYALRVTAPTTEHTIGTSAECDVIVSRRIVTIGAEDAGKTYDGTPQAEAVLSVIGLINEDNVSVRANTAYDSAMPGNRKLHVTSAVLTGADAGKYRLSSGNFAFDAFIDKMPGKEVAVAAQAETIYGRGDGKIIGTSTDMEWREGGAETWDTCPEGELAGLYHGEYEIRMKETDISHAGPAAVFNIVSERTLGVTVTDESGHTQTVGVAYGQKLDRPATPVKSGYTFSGWYRDPELTIKWDFENDTVTDDVTLYPKWTRDSSGGSGSSSGGSSSGGPSSGSRTNGGSGIAAVSGAWTRDTAGNWRFTSERRYENEWAYVTNPYADAQKGQSHTDWFHFGADGIMDVGWITDADGHMYYLNPVSDNTMGRMLTGWNWLRGADGLLRCYYFEPNSNGHRGVLYRNAITPDGYEVGADGAWIVNGSAVTRE